MNKKGALGSSRRAGGECTCQEQRSQIRWGGDDATDIYHCYIDISR